VNIVKHWSIIIYSLHEFQIILLLNNIQCIIYLLSFNAIKTLGEFDVDVSDVLATLNGLVSHKLTQSSPSSSSDTSKSNEEMNSLCTLYDSFLRDCNSRDWADVVAAVVTERRRNTQLHEVITRTDFLCINVSDHDIIEVSFCRFNIQFIWNLISFEYFLYGFIFRIPFV